MSARLVYSHAQISSLNSGERGKKVEREEIGKNKALSPSRARQPNNRNSGGSAKCHLVVDVTKNFHIILQVRHF